MITNICWGFCHDSFDMAGNTNFPPILRRIYELRGAFWYWAALTLEGRAVAFWKEA